MAEQSRPTEGELEILAVLGVSLALAAIAALGLGYFWMHPGLIGGQ